MNSMNRIPTPRSYGRNVAKFYDLVVVHASHHDHVHLDRREPGVDRGIDAGDHPIELVAPREREEGSRRNVSSDTFTA